MSTITNTTAQIAVEEITAEVFIEEMSNLLKDKKDINLVLPSTDAAVGTCPVFEGLYLQHTQLLEAMELLEKLNSMSDNEQFKVIGALRASVMEHNGAPLAVTLGDEFVRAYNDGLVGTHKAEAGAETMLLPKHMLTSRVREVVQESGCTYLPRSFNYSKEVVRVPDFLVGMLLKDLPQGTVVTCLQEDLDEVLTCKVSHPDHRRNMDFAEWAHKVFRNQL